ncbi:hypothetical protein EI555_000626 [Monodon monoceros]|uniref:Uncharacterized protein n=1 Tax=Monodon monoceros TaxID=40151 RepID=A0A4U1EW24_MONMO|nr:hypothetical protein EI555_000626 [Monodon monoceros]
MGNSPSVECHYIRLLKQLLRSSGVKVKQESFDEFFAEIRKHCYWFQPTGHNQLNLKVWKQVMRALRRAHQYGDPISVRVWSLCNLISLALESLQSETESENGARPQRPNSAPDHSATFRTLSRESPIEDLPPPPPLMSETGEDFSGSSDEGALSDDDKGREQASKQNEMPLSQQNEISDILSKLKNLMAKLEENKNNATTPSYQEPCPTIPSAPPLELAAYPVGASRQFRFPLKPECNKLLLEEEMNKEEKQYSEPFFAFPIVRQAMPANDQFPNGYMNVEDNPHDFKILKMLKEAINAYGMHSNYVQGLLSGYASKNILIPQDWEALARTVLEPGQYMQFKTWWKEEAENMARTNVARNPPGPLLDELIGAGAFSNVQAQAEFDDLRIIQICMCCLRAWLRVEPPGKTAQSFTKLMQGPGEPYTDFLSRLRAAIQRAVAQIDVQDLLLQSLAFENANPEC